MLDPYNTPKSLSDELQEQEAQQATISKKDEIKFNFQQAKSCLAQIELEFNQKFSQASTLEKAKLVGFKAVLTPFILAAKTLIKYFDKEVLKLELKDD